ncbi:MAG: proprotein convertase P-domain-containing protein, partial [Deltaproteobacteria bacterium]|nr:proprotein convertase P-domain-containing protein [Deltaproteobacteria bacterium]MBW2533820.1 proprotein convertase P-domain-containing protein [Deltaproteobacteria bacterium]
APGDIPEYTNPFTDSEEGGKGDTGYYNLRGVELHVTLEADLEADGWRMFDGPAELGQYAVTRLKKTDQFYIELLAEDQATPDRVEWLVEGQWLDKEQAEQVDRSLLKRWRLRDVNAVVLDRNADEIEVSAVYQAEVPLRPFKTMTEADDSCADYNSHIELSQSVYWYLWNPSKSSCAIDTQTLSVTVTEVLPRGFATYPEYDELWADDTLTVAVFWAKLDDDAVEDDYNWDNVEKFSNWLTDADFVQQDDAPMGQRFIKQIGDKSILVDVYGPDVFHSVADWSRLSNWQAAVSEHEVVLYNGHSVLGTGMAFERVNYPDFYQVFQVASCLSYEYYVRPILEGKGGWENVDIISNVEPTYYHENLPLSGAMLAKLFWGFEHGGQASWQDIMEAVSRKLYHSRFGVSGARDNCYSPQGSLCTEGACEAHLEQDACESAGCAWAECPPNATCDRPYICLPAAASELRYDSTGSVDIPDNDPAGASSSVEVPDEATIASLKVELDISHTYTGDLQVVLYHGEVSHTLWQREGGSSDDIRGTFDVPAFEGQPLAGTWTLRVVDMAGWDEGTINGWSLLATPAE